MTETDKTPKTASKQRWAIRAMLALTLAAGATLALAKIGGHSRLDATSPSARTGAGKQWVAAQTVAATSAASSIRELPAERQVDLAFDAVFGKGEREIELSDDASFAYSRGKVIWAEFGPVLIVEGNGDPYPAALGTLGIFYLRELPGGTFEEVHRWPDAVAGGIMGNPPSWKVRQDIVDHPVIEATAGGVWQGYACDATSLTELTPAGPKSLVVFNSQYDSRSAGVGAGEYYAGAITQVVRNRSFDVRFTGTRQLTRHYVRNGEVYESSPSDTGKPGGDDIPTC